MTLDNVPIKACIWDTVGQEQYRSINRSFYKNAVGAWIVNDLSLLITSKSLDMWLQELKTFADKNLRIAIVGNKCDLEKNEDTVKLFKGYAEKYNYPYYEMSAKTGENVKSAFYSTIKEIKDLFYPNWKPSDKPSDTIRLSSESKMTEDNDVSKCC